jgi:hypothetical protein
MTLPNASIDGFRFAQPILQHGAGRRSNSRTRGHRRTIYNTLNQYHVVMEVAPEYWQNSETLNNVFVSTSGGAASGTQTTNALAGTVSGPTSATSTGSGCFPTDGAFLILIVAQFSP